MDSPATARHGWRLPRHELAILLATAAVYVLTGQQMQISLEIPGGLRSEEVAEQRKYLKETGFLPPVDARELIRAMDAEVVSSLEETQDYEQVHTVEELFQALGVDPTQGQQPSKSPASSRARAVGDDDLPLLEPVD